MVSNPFISRAEILNIITSNSFKITFQILKLLKIQACIKVYYLLFTQLIHCGTEKKTGFVFFKPFWVPFRFIFYLIL